MRFQRFNILISTVILVLLAPASAWPKPAGQVTRGSANISPPPARFLRPPAAAAGPVGDLVATGRYAYVAVDQNLETWDLRSPNHPLLVASVTLTNTIYRLVAAGNYLYVLAFNFQVLSLADPAAPAMVASVPNVSFSSNDQLVVHGGYAYLGSSTQLLVINVSNPANPQPGASQALDVQQLKIAGQYLYATGTTGLKILSVANPAAPAMVGGLSNVWNSPSGLAVAGDYAYVVGSGMPFYVVNVSNPAAPAIAAHLDHLQNDGLTDIAVIGSKAYLASSDGYIGGFPFLILFTADVSVPAAPRIVDTYYASGLLNRVRLGGVGLLGAFQDAGWTLLGLTTYGLPFDLGPTFGAALVGPPAVPITPTHRIYLPAILRTTDLSIAGMEVTQAIQRPDNGVPLVAGRPTMLRVYGQAIGANPVDGVSLAVAGTRNGLPLPGSPLTLTSWAVFQNPDRGLYGQSFNLPLPASWISGSITLVATIDPGLALPDANVNNNTLQVSVSFTPMPPLALKLVPINFTTTNDGQLHPAMTQDRISAMLQRLYPVDAITVSIRAPINFSGNLHGDAGNPFGDWLNLLSTISQLKSADGAPEAQDYFGVVPFEAYQGGFGGVGFIGTRVAVGVDQGPGDILGSSLLAAHEIGHTFGLQHAPCGNPAGPDPAYPYPDGSIGQYGFDAFDQRVYPPSRYHDVMSYCTFQWFSDYNYAKLFDDQLAHGAVAAAQDAGASSLLIRATFTADGQPTLLPVYQLNSAPDTPAAASDYSLQLIGPSGAPIAQYPVPIDTPAFESGGNPPAWLGSLISVRVPLPAETIARIRLLHQTVVAAERALSSPNPAGQTSVSIRRTSSHTLVDWTPAKRPALLRYSPDRGQTWTTVGLDATGGELILDPAQLSAGAAMISISQGDSIAPPTVINP